MPEDIMNTIGGPGSSEDIMNTIGGCCESLKQCEVENAVSDRLLNRKKRLELQLSEVNEALDALQKNPEIQRVLDLVARASRH